MKSLKPRLFGVRSALMHAAFASAISASLYASALSVHYYSEFKNLTKFELMPNKTVITKTVTDATLNKTNHSGIKLQNPRTVKIGKYNTRRVYRPAQEFVLVGITYKDVIDSEIRELINKTYVSTIKYSRYRYSMISRRVVKAKWTSSGPIRVSLNTWPMKTAFNPMRMVVKRSDITGSKTPINIKIISGIKRVKVKQIYVRQDILISGQYLNNKLNTQDTQKHIQFNFTPFNNENYTENYTAPRGSVGAGQTYIADLRKKDDVAPFKQIKQKRINDLNGLSALIKMPKLIVPNSEVAKSIQADIQKVTLTPIQKKGTEYLQYLGLNHTDNILSTEILSGTEKVILKANLDEQKLEEKRAEKLVEKKVEKKTAETPSALPTMPNQQKTEVFQAPIVVNISSKDDLQVESQNAIEASAPKVEVAKYTEEDINKLINEIKGRIFKPEIEKIESTPVIMQSFNQPVAQPIKTPALVVASVVASVVAPVVAPIVAPVIAPASTPPANPVVTPKAPTFTKENTNTNTNSITNSIEDAIEKTKKVMEASAIQKQETVMEYDGRCEPGFKVGNGMSGRVVRAFGNSSEPIEGAEVEVVGTSIKTTTDACGYFHEDEINFYGTAGVRVSKVGFRSTLVERNIATLNINKSLEPIELIEESQIQILEAHTVESLSAQAIMFGYIASEKAEDRYGKMIEVIGSTSAKVLYLDNKLNPDPSLKFTALSGRFIILGIPSSDIMVGIKGYYGEEYGAYLTHVDSGFAYIQNFILGEKHLVKGHVLSSLSGKPIRSANIQVMGGSKIVKTNEKGEFEIKDVYLDCKNKNYIQVEHEKAYRQRFDLNCMGSSELYLLGKAQVDQLVSESNEPLRPGTAMVFGKIGNGKIKSQIISPEDTLRSLKSANLGLDFYFNAKNEISPAQNISDESSKFIMLNATQGYRYLQVLDHEGYLKSVRPVFLSPDTISVIVE